MKHLNEEQFVEWASGERDEVAAQHLRECPACLAEVQALQATFAGFAAEIRERDAARVPFTGAQIRARAIAQETPRRPLWKLLPVPALAATAVVAVMLSTRAPEPKPAPDLVAHNAAGQSNDAADEALLVAVSTDLYSAAPQALRPAATLNKERNQLLTESQKKK